ncbi:hypothetical protein C8N35_104244 [Breoghania corrubedonensis]|uniref:Uncharacterized protein n=1 Tax=Breoghania corrubedonensis TaxID=665038 RepID=A0A2T5VA40_9HYPH|nr:hypothetical protein C8N35_104244 [Breoghania corrubedonensis]
MLRFIHFIKSLFGFKSARKAKKKDATIYPMF